MKWTIGPGEGVYKETDIVVIKFGGLSALSQKIEANTLLQPKSTDNFLIFL